MESYQITSHVPSFAELLAVVAGEEESVVIQTADGPYAIEKVTAISPLGGDDQGYTEVTCLANGVPASLMLENDKGGRYAGGKLRFS